MFMTMKKCREREKNFLQVNCRVNILLRFECVTFQNYYFFNRSIHSVFKTERDAHLKRENRRTARSSLATAKMMRRARRKTNDSEKQRQCRMSAYETLAYSPMANGAMHRSIEINVPNSGKEKQNRKTNETLNVTSAIFLFGIFEIACLFIFTG